MIEEIKKLIDHIAYVSGTDCEAAHILEDELYQSVLEYIASGSCENPQEIAIEALKTKKMPYPRYYA